MILYPEKNQVTGIQQEENWGTYWVSFAYSRASSSVLNILTQRTGPKTSSLQICMEVITSVIIVGSTKKSLL